MQRASVGRVVHYRAQPEEAPQAALIVHVRDANDPDTVVNLVTFSSVGKVAPIHDVGRRVGQAGPSWDWPDFVPPFGGKADSGPVPTSPNVIEATVAEAVQKALSAAGLDPATITVIRTLIDDTAPDGSVTVEVEATAETETSVEVQEPAESAAKPAPKRATVRK